MPVEPFGEQHMVRLTVTQTKKARLMADDAGLRFAQWLRSLVLAEIDRVEESKRQEA